MAGVHPAQAERHCGLMPALFIAISTCFRRRARCDGPHQGDDPYVSTSTLPATSISGDATLRTDLQDLEWSLHRGRSHGPGSGHTSQSGALLEPFI